MKRQVRRGTFETNSSSVHSITMCMDDEYSRWENGEVLFWENRNEFGTKEEIIEKMKKEKRYNGTLRFTGDFNDPDYVYDVFCDEGVKTYDSYFDDCEFETFEEEYITPAGDTVIAFGYYGR